VVGLQQNCASVSAHNTHKIFDAGSVRKLGTTLAALVVALSPGAAGKADATVFDFNAIAPGTEITGVDLGGVTIKATLGDSVVVQALSPS
jgi:hypothetical protein